MAAQENEELQHLIEHYASFLHLPSRDDCYGPHEWVEMATWKERRHQVLGYVYGIARRGDPSGFVLEYVPRIECNEWPPTSPGGGRYPRPEKTDLWDVSDYVVLEKRGVE